MVYSIENEKIKIVANTHGGELLSLREKKENIEYLWDGNSKYWEYHAPVLFPIVGKTKNYKYKIGENIYKLPAHGLARISNFELIAQTEDSLTFELTDCEDSIKVYPYKFSLQIKYVIVNSSVNVIYTVKNLDIKEILFSIGAHPAFMCPIDKNEILEDCYLEFNKKETSSVMGVNKDAYISRKRKECLNDSNIIPLSKELFNNGVLIFDDLKSDEVTIKSKKSDKRLTVEFKNFPCLGLWAPEKGAPFLCIEPWFGKSDYDDFNGEFKDKEGIILLGIEELFQCSYKIIIG